MESVHIAEKPKSQAAVLPDASSDIDTTEYIIKLKGVTKTYLLGLEGVPALRGVDLNVAPGEVVMFVGKSGSGKSSLLNVIGTIDTPTRGEVSIAGTHITSSTSDSELARIRRTVVSFIFQAFNLIPGLTAEENVSLPLTLSRWGGNPRQRARALLRAVGLKDRMGHTAAQMSGGEQQRVTICRALATGPSLLVCEQATCMGLRAVPYPVLL